MINKLMLTLIIITATQAIAITHNELESIRATIYKIKMDGTNKDTRNKAKQELIHLIGNYKDTLSISTEMSNCEKLRRLSLQSMINCAKIDFGIRN